MNSEMNLRFGRIFQRALGLSLVLAAALVGCGETPPKYASVSVVVYNYSQEPVLGLRINGGYIGGFEQVPQGSVTGGGVVCCFEIQEGAKQVDLEMSNPDGSKYTVTADVEQWWFDLANYGVIHVLPGRKVVMQVTQSAPLPRKDLLEAQQKAMGLPVKVNFKMWSAGPIQRLDGKQ